MIVTSSIGRRDNRVFLGLAHSLRAESGANQTRSEIRSWISCCRELPIAMAADFRHVTVKDVTGACLISGTCLVRIQVGPHTASPQPTP